MHVKEKMRNLKLNTATHQKQHVITLSGCQKFDPNCIVSDDCRMT